MTPRGPLVAGGPAAVALVAAGGAAGTLARYGLDESVGAGSWPWSTLLVNLAGSLALGLLVGATVPTAWRLVLGTGVLGGFTTYSAFAVQVDARLRDGEVATAVGYAVTTVVAGLALAVVGVRLAERLR